MRPSPRLIVIAGTGCAFAVAAYLLATGGFGEVESEPGKHPRRARILQQAPPPAAARSSSVAQAEAVTATLPDPHRRSATGVRGGTARPAYLARLRDAVAGDGPERDQNLMQALQEMRGEDAPATYQFVKETMKSGGGFNVDRTWQAFWMQYGKVDVAGALAQAEHDDSEYGQKDRVRKHLYAGWGLEQPAEALAKLVKEESLPERGRGVEGISAVWAERDPAAAGAWIASNLEGGFLATALGALQWGAVTAKGGTAAADMFASLPRTPEADAAVEALGVSLSQTPGVLPADRLHAAEVIRDRGLYNGTLLNTVAGDLMKSDPPQNAAEYLTGFQPPEKDQAFQPLLNVVNQWGRMDPIAAGNWVNAQQGRPWFDSAAAGYAQAIRPLDPAASAAWAARIRSEAIRSELR